MRITFWVVLILFTIVKTKIVHYSSMAYFPLSFLGAFWFYRQQTENLKMKLWQSITFLVVGIILAIAFSAFPIIDRYKTFLIEKGLLSDAFAIAQFRATLQWKGFEIFIGLLMFIAVIYGFIMLRKAAYEHFIQRSALLMMLSYFMAIVFLVPRGEEYSQKVYIDFLKEVSTEDAYVKVMHMKSYAPFFYGEVKPENTLTEADTEWLKFGDIDKRVYFIMRNKRKEKFQAEVPDAILIREKNGYVFMKREKIQNELLKHD
jgi:hypothetical protein